MTTAKNGREAFVLSDVGPFSILPEWLLYSGVSDRALRIFAILHRHDGPGGAYPGRKRLAELAKCSLASVDRAIEELVEAQAVKVTTRSGPEGQRSNYYAVFLSSPASRGSITGATTPLVTREEGALVTGDEHNESSEVTKKPVGTQASEPAKVDDTPKPTGSGSGAKKPTWAGEQYPLLLRLVPTITMGEGFALLNKFAKKYPHGVIEAALKRLLDEGDEFGVRMIWAVFENECKRALEANAKVKPGGGGSTTIQGNARGLGAYLDGNEPKPEGQGGEHAG